HTYTDMIAQWRLCVSLTCCVTKAPATTAIYTLSLHDGSSDLRIEVPPAEVGIAENAVRLWAAAQGASVEPTQYCARSALLTVLVAPSDLEALRADTARWSSGRRTVQDAGRRTADVPL